MYHIARVSHQQPSEETARKLEIALQMFALGESIMHQNLRRAHPTATAAQMEKK
jgi:hypothetical protein